MMPSRPEAEELTVDLVGDDLERIPPVGVGCVGERPEEPSPRNPDTGVIRKFQDSIIIKPPHKIKPPCLAEDCRHHQDES